MRKFISISLVLLLIMFQLPILGMANEEKTDDRSDILLKSIKTKDKYGNDKETIKVGDTFDLELNFEISDKNNTSILD